MNLFISHSITSLKITLVLIVSVFILTSCLSDEDEDNTGALHTSEIVNCKTCENIDDTNMTIEVCEYDDNTIRYTIFAGGLVVVEDVIEMKEGESFEDYDCDYFKNINTESLD